MDWRSRGYVLNATIHMSVCAVGELHHRRLPASLCRALLATWKFRVELWRRRCAWQAEDAERAKTRAGGVAA